MELNARTIGEHILWFYNERESDAILAEVFDQEQYRFKSQRPNPFIIDCGAHIGISILYFKIRYPSARILAFEPDPLNLAILRKNIESNRFIDVIVVERAVANKEGKAILYRETTDAYRSNKGIRWTWSNSLLARKGFGRLEEFPVRTVCLSGFLDQPVDFLKIDIEGAEEQVIKEIQHRLNQVRNITIEYHGRNTDREVNDLYRIIEDLQTAGFCLDLISEEKQERYLDDAKNLQDRLLLIRGVRQ